MDFNLNQVGNFLFTLTDSYGQTVFALRITSAGRSHIAMLVFSEPQLLNRHFPPRNTTKKRHTHAGCVFFWWTLTDLNR